MKCSSASDGGKQQTRENNSNAGEGICKRGEGGSLVRGRGDYWNCFWKAANCSWRVFNCADNVSTSDSRREKRFASDWPK